MSIHLGSVEKPKLEILLFNVLCIENLFTQLILSNYIYANNTINISTVNIESTINKFITVKLISNQSKFVGNHASQMLHRFCRHNSSVTIATQCTSFFST